MWILNKYGILLLAGILIAAVWHGLSAIVVLTSLVLAATGFTRLWGRYCLSRVSCSHSLSDTRLFPEEFTEITLKVGNRKLLPLPWIQVDEEIPVELVPDKKTIPAERPGYRLWSHMTSLLWYRAVSWRCRLYCSRRGYYPIGPVTVTSGDIFGLYSRSHAIRLDEPVIVYPRIYPIERLDIPSIYPMGETRAERRIFQDPTRTLGVRDYRPDDGLRYIHWKASARRQQLQVKVFEPTTTWKTALFLAVDSFSGGSDFYNEEIFELGVSTVASIARYVIDQGSSVGLYVNTKLADSGQAVSMAPSGSRSRLAEILEALAKVSPVSSSPFESYLQGELQALPWGTTMVFVLSGISKTVASLLSSLKLSGYRMLVLSVGKGEQEGHGYLEGHIPWFPVQSPGDLLTEIRENI